LLFGAGYKHSYLYFLPCQLYTRDDIVANIAPTGRGDDRPVCPISLIEYWRLDKILDGVLEQ